MSTLSTDGEMDTTAPAQADLAASHAELLAAAHEISQGVREGREPWLVEFRRFSFDRLRVAIARAEALGADNQSTGGCTQ